jgi:pilus assembly protein CpaF
LLVKAGEFWEKFKGREPFISEESEKEEDEIIELKKRVHRKLIEKLDLKHLEIDMSDPAKANQIREKTERIISSALTEETGVFISSFEIRKKLVKEISDEALGLGPLEDLVADSEISDILVNNKNQIYIEKHGKIELSPKRFLSNDQVRQVIERIIAPLGRRIDESVPMVDARLPDGSRVNAIIPPLSLTGPTLTIRKFGRERLNIDDLLRLNTLTEPIRDFLRACIAVRKNIIVSCGTGSGKTTVLNVLSAFIPPNERIITLEDAAELKLKQEHWVRLESRPPNVEGRGMITIRDLFRNSLRMRPDRIIIGECRGGETLDMLQAMNTGHDGSLTTIHANSTQDVLVRMDSMILMSGVELPIRAIREMIASAIDIIVHTARLSDGSRKIIQITELAGMKDEVHIELQDVFLFRQTGTDSEGRVIGNFRATGYLPSFLDEIKVKGIPLSEDVFKAP